jgi:glucosylceramidase
VSAFLSNFYLFIQNLNHFVSGWVDWNLVLDTQGGPNWANNWINAAIIVNKTSHEYYKQPFFYALGHFSKFLVPDSVKVQSTEKSHLDRFETTAFVRPDNATVIIALNMRDESVELNIDDSIEGKISHVVKPRSLQTYIYYN